MLGQGSKKCILSSTLERVYIMSKSEKIRALIQYEINWAIENGDTSEASQITDYIVALFNNYTDQAIHKLYANKFED